MRNFRGVVDDLSTALEENLEITTIAGAVLGALLATAIDRYGPGPDPQSFAITVDQARASLLSALALVFTGLSIVLALTALTAGNMASKFSPRLLRMGLRGSGNKWVLATFSLTAGFIITSQVLLRTFAADDLAPPLTMSTSVVLLVVTGVNIIGYINGTLQSLRVDRAIQWIGRQILRAITAREKESRHDVVVDVVDTRRPEDAAELRSPDDGYIVHVDTGRLQSLMSEPGAMVWIDAGSGRPVIRGETIGWVSAPSQVRDDELLDCLTIARSRDPQTDVGYTIGVLVDIALMALSPAVNDPRTGVECTEALTEVFAELSRRKTGIRTRLHDDGSPSVVVTADTLGDHLDAAGRQILLYGSDDRTVTAALLRLGQQGERFATSERDRRLASAFASDVEAIRADTARTDGSAW